MVATRWSARAATRSRLAASPGSSVDEEGSSSTSWNSDTASSASSFSPVRENSNSRNSSKGNDASNDGDSRAGSAVMTRKRRLLQEAEAQLAFGVATYWEGGVDLGGEIDREKLGTPRRSRRGEARRKYEDAAGLPREQPKLDVNLPPMVSTREGKVLAVEVFGNGVLYRLYGDDRGARVGHCSSGYVCGYPVPRGKEGNRWCQTPVRASLESKLACMHHSLYRKAGGAGPSKEQLRFMMLADEFYDQQTGDICWQRVVSYLRTHELPLELSQRRQVLNAGGRAVAVADTKIILHGFVQCLFFWLAACRLTRRRYEFTMVAHASKSDFKEFLARLRRTAAWPPPSPASSPLVCMIDKNSAHHASYYASGYAQALEHALTRLEGEGKVVGRGGQRAKTGFSFWSRERIKGKRCVAEGQQSNSSCRVLVFRLRVVLH